MLGGEALRGKGEALSAGGSGLGGALPGVGGAKFAAWSFEAGVPDPELDGASGGLSGGAGGALLAVGADSLSVVGGSGAGDAAVVAGSGAGLGDWGVSGVCMSDPFGC